MLQATHPSARSRVAQLLALGLFTTAGLAAQTGTTPGFSRKPQPSWIMVNSFTSVPGNDIQQVFTIKLSSDKDGEWTACHTVGALPAFFGGDDKNKGIVIGTFAPYAGTYTVANYTKALNSGKEANLTLDRSGLWAIFDRDTGVWVSKRSSTTSAFPAPKQVAGFGSLRDVMPALGMHGGKMRVFYTDRARVLMHEIDLNMTAPKLVGQPTVVSLPLQEGAKPLRPTPLVGGDGDVEGLFLAEEVKPHSGTGTGDADPVWAADLDPNTPPIMMINRTDWQPGGAPAGGFLSFGHDIKPRFHLMHSEIAWMIGDVEKPGGTADLRVVGVNHSHPTPLVSAVYASAGTIKRIVLPKINGWLGLNPASLISFGFGVHPTKEGSAVLRYPIPNDNSLKGLKLHLQAVVVDSKKGQLTFTNTAALSIE